MFRLLDDYHNSQPTRSCFLDGRYIPIVLKDVVEFNQEPLHVHIELDKQLHVVSSTIKGSARIHEGMNISRVVIHTPLVAHSALVWIDTRAKTVTFTDVRSRTDQDSSSPFNGYMDKVDVVTSKLLKEFFSDILTHSADYKYLVDIAYVDEIQSADCQKFGYCNAYVIKQVVDYKSDREFDSRDIAKFASTIERKYKHLLNVNEPAEIEYIVGGLGLGLGLGVLGGAAIAGAASASRPQYVYQQQYPAYGYGYPAYQGYPAYGGYY